MRNLFSKEYEICSIATAFRPHSYPFARGVSHVQKMYGPQSGGFRSLNSNCCLSA